MPRRSFTILAGISFALAVLLLGTYFISECNVRLSDGTVPIAAMGIERDRAVVVLARPLPWPRGMDFHFGSFRWPDKLQLWQFAAFSGSGSGKTYGIFYCPIWCAAAVFLIPPAIWLYKKRKNRGRGFQVLPVSGVESSVVPE